MNLPIRNLQKYVLNHNKELSYLYQNHNQSHIQVDDILGAHSNTIKGPTIFCINNQEVIYFADQYFIVRNVINKESHLLPSQKNGPRSTLLIQKLENKDKHKIIIRIYLYNNTHYIQRLIIKNKLIQAGRLQKDSFQYKTNKLSTNIFSVMLSISFHQQKQYLYILTFNQSSKIYNVLAFDFKKQCLMLKSDIKSSAKCQIDRIWVTENHTQIYLMGINYFRFWNVNFHQKCLKQSNYRNIQRVLTGRKILNIFYSLYQGSKVLSIITQNSYVILRKNQLIKMQRPSNRAIDKSKNKENIQVQLQNSLNQIYKMKYLFDQEDCGKIQTNFSTPSNYSSESQLFACSSKSWNGNQDESITVASKSGNILTFSLVNGQLKLTHQLVARKNHNFDYIDISQNGQMIILSQNKGSNLYLINKYSINNQQNQDIRLFWGMGQISVQNICSISSPAIHQRVGVLTTDNMFKLWSFKKGEKSIMFEQKIDIKPTQIVMHPCGNLVAFNSLREVKLMSILPQGLFEIASVKTNYSSIDLKYSKSGNFLVGNQQSLLIFYNPFSLKTLGYIQCPELKSIISSFDITPFGNYIIYQTSQKNVYITPINLHTPLKKYQIQACNHTAFEIYNCYYFQTLQNQQNQNIFVGFGQSKYMVLYKNLGKQLIAQFKDTQCFVERICISDGYLIAATSKGSLRVYRWPIIQSQLQLQIVDKETKSVRYVHPKYKQYNFWSDNKKINNIHKINFNKQIIVAREGGKLTVLKNDSYEFERKEQKQKKKDEQQRKKLTQIVNDMFFITKVQCEKRNKLIQKTQTDILKVENEISKQKTTLDKKYKQQCEILFNNHLQKTQIHQKQKSDYLNNLNNQIKQLQNIIQKQKLKLNINRQKTQKQNESKIKYEQNRNNNLQLQIKNLLQYHEKFKIQNKQQQKQKIKEMNKQYYQKVKQLKKESEQIIYLELRKKQLSHKLDDKQYINQSQTIELKHNVEQIRKSKQQLQNKLQQIKQKVKNAQKQDQIIQRQFQKKLQNYNTYRFKNLNLHSQVLKMRTQLIQRKQIMQNKEIIIKNTFLQRIKLQNYKQMVKGALHKLQNRKQNIYHTFVSKQNQVDHIFIQLANNINNLQKLKYQQYNLQAQHRIYQQKHKNWDGRLKQSLIRLKQLKKYLLLQGQTDDAERKKMYIQQQNILNLIAFYKKRINMETLKQKKNKTLKKSSVNLILKQNKNLLQECNKLREQATIYGHQLKNLNYKLGEANKIINLQTKLKDQKQLVGQQRKDLQAIRQIFNKQMAQFNQEQIDIL